MIFVVGVFGNGLVCVVVIKENFYCFFVYCLIFNLVISDLGVFFFSFLFGVLCIEDVNLLFGEFGCIVLYFLSDVFYGVFIVSIIVIVVFCYWGIILGYGLSYKGVMKIVRIVILLVWVLLFLFFVVFLFFVMDYVERGGKVVCYLKFLSKMFYKFY